MISYQYYIKIVYLDTKAVGKNKNKWNIFQRSNRSKSATSDEVCQDPSELQRVSYATSINDLPSRPSAFLQVQYVVYI